MKQAGIVYGMMDPTQYWVKIGCVEEPTVDRLRRRWKSLRPVGNHLLVRRAVRVEDVKESEEKLHAIFEPVRIQGGERFNVKPDQFCPAMHILANGRGDRDIADFIKEVEREVRKHRRLNDHEEKIWAQYKLVSPLDSSSEDSAAQSAPPDPATKEGRRRRPNLSLVQLMLKDGDVLTHARDKSVMATVVDPEEGIVDFEDDTLHISVATKIMQKRVGHTTIVRPYNHWKFKEKLLSDKAEEIYREKGLPPGRS